MSELQKCGPHGLQKVALTVDFRLDFLPTKSVHAK